MKITNLFLLAATFAGAIAAPAAEADEPANDEVSAQASCWNRSNCGIDWSGNCEGYCRPYKFSHMDSSDCGWFQKRCCCVKP